jgi:O-succinylbenzoate synthase
MFEHDVVAQPLRPVDGRLLVGAVTPDPDALRSVLADPATSSRWRARLDECAAALAGSLDVPEDQAR